MNITAAISTQSPAFFPICSSLFATSQQRTTGPRLPTHHDALDEGILDENTLPFGLPVELHYLRKLHWGEMEIPLNRQTKRPACLEKLGEAEVTQLLFKPNDPAKKQVFAIEFQGIERPVAIRSEKFTDDERIFLMFLRIERREHVP